MRFFMASKLLNNNRLGGFICINNSFLFSTRQEPPWLFCVIGEKINGTALDAATARAISTSFKSTQSQSKKSCVKETSCPAVISVALITAKGPLRCSRSANFFPRYNARLSCSCNKSLRPNCGEVSRGTLLTENTSLMTFFWKFFFKKELLNLGIMSCPSKAK